VYSSRFKFNKVEMRLVTEFAALEASVACRNPRDAVRSAPVSPQLTCDWPSTARELLSNKIRQFVMSRLNTQERVRNATRFVARNGLF
jgi:hypothetical protein